MFALVPLLTALLPAGSPSNVKPEINAIVSLFPRAQVRVAKRHWGKTERVEYIGPIFRKTKMGYVRVDEVKTVSLGRDRLIVFPIYLTKRTKTQRVETLVEETEAAASEDGLTLIQAILVDADGKFLGKAPTFPLEHVGTWSHAFAGRHYMIMSLKPVDMSGAAGAEMIYGVVQYEQVRYFGTTTDRKLDVSKATDRFDAARLMSPDVCENVSVKRTTVIHEPGAYFDVGYETSCACEAAQCKAAGLKPGEAELRRPVRSVSN